MENKYHGIQGLLMRNGRIHRRVVESRMNSLGIHSSQHVLLMHLNRLGRMPSQMQLAAMLDVSPASVARTLKSLEQGGYIERFDASEDGRCNEICITEKGKAVCCRSIEIFDEIDGTTFAGFSEAELDQLAGMLERMQANLIGAERAEKGGMCRTEREMKKL